MELYYTTPRSDEEIIKSFATWKNRRAEWTPQIGAFLKIMKLDLTATDFRHPRLDYDGLREMPKLVETDQQVQNPVYSN